jgi:D-amino-acid dehydrogenase
MKDVKQESNTGVVGGGIIGLCCALQLQRAGHKTWLIDPTRDRRPASFGNAGHIAIEQTEPLASRATIRSAWSRLDVRGGAVSLPWQQAHRWLPFALAFCRAAQPKRFEQGKAALSSLAAEAMPAWRRLSASLPRKDLLIERGHIVAWCDPAAAERGLAAWRATDTGTARFHPAGKDELASLARITTRRLAGAIVFENTGQVADPGAVLASLEQAFVAAGGIRRKGLVRAIRLVQDRAELQLADGKTLRPDRIVLTAGVESGALLTELGLRVPIIAERGYHIQTRDHGWPADLPPVVFEEQSMIVNRFESGLRASSFVEFSQINAPPDPRKWQRLKEHAAMLGLPVQAPFTHWIGARPTLPDYLPAIGRSSLAKNLSYAFGHQHLGLTLGPITGELIAALLADGEPAVSLKPFDLARFQAGG